jgi:hypothetical protein
MGNVFGIGPGAGASRHGGRGTLLLAIALVLTSLDPAFACRGMRNWSTGADLAKLKPGEVVVKARLLESYRDEVRFPYAIMGIAYGMIYYLDVIEVIGGAGASGVELEGLAEAKIYVRLNPSVCEAYYPLNFSRGDAKTLVLKKGATGLYELVGGQE